MCDCKYASRISNGVFHCTKFGRFGWQGPLRICTMAQLQESWEKRMSQVPRQIIERERAYLGEIYIKEYMK